MTLSNAKIMIQKIKNIFILMLCLTLGAVSIQAQEVIKEITGRVLSAANNTPLPGVTVAVPGLSSAMTSDDGTFKLRVPSYDTELLVNSPLYESKHVALKGQQTIVIKLQEKGFKASVYKEVLTPLGYTNNSHLTTAATFLEIGRAHV